MLVGEKMGSREYLEGHLSFMRIKITCLKTTFLRNKYNELFSNSSYSEGLCKLTLHMLIQDLG